MKLEINELYRLMDLADSELARTKNIIEEIKNVTDYNDKEIEVAKEKIKYFFKDINKKEFNDLKNITNKINDLFIRIDYFEKLNGDKKLMLGFNLDKAIKLSNEIEDLRNKRIEQNGENNEE